MTLIVDSFKCLLLWYVAYICPSHESDDDDDDDDDDDTHLSHTASLTHMYISGHGL